jgi:VWFA-related protein
MKPWRPTDARRPRMAALAPVVVLSVGALLLASRGNAVSALAGPASSSTQASRVLQVTVVTDKGAAVPDLTPADFEVKEDGKVRPVQQAGPATRPVTVALLLDDKGSDINEIRAALAAFVARVQGKAEVSLLTVVPTTMTVFDYTSSAPSMMAGIQRLVWRPGPPGGLLLGAIAAAADELKRREAERAAIVVVTFEGEEPRSHRPASGVLAALERSRAALHVVAVGRPTMRRMARAPTEDVQGDDWTVDEQNRNAVLGDGPKQSGGRRHELTVATGLTRALEAVADDLVNQYTIVYAAPIGTKPSTKLTVSVKKRGVTVRAPTRVGGT